MSPTEARAALAKMREAVEWTKRHALTRNKDRLTRHAWVALLADLERIAEEPDSDLLPSEAFRDSAKDHGEAGEAGR
jgi:hypothetical protein